MFYGNFNDPADQALMKQLAEALPRMFGRVYLGDNNILLGRSLSFLEDPKFLAAMQRQAKNDQEQSLAVRMNTLVWAFDNALQLEGDIVECGVWRGFSFGFLTDYFDFAGLPKTLWLYDTFEGIPAEYDTEGQDTPALREAGLYESVVARFAAFPNVNVVKGLLPASLEGASPSRISLLHLDMNSSRGEIETLDALFDRVVPGGMIILDDYGWAMYRAQHDAEKAWAAERGYRILETPNGQGVLIKR